MRKFPRPLLRLLHTVAFPLVISLAWYFDKASLGMVIISAQISLIGVSLQTYFWSEAEFYEVRSYLFRDKK